MARRRGFCRLPSIDDMSSRAAFCRSMRRCISTQADIADDGVGLATQTLLDLSRKTLGLRAVVEIPDGAERGQRHHEHGQEELGKDAEARAQCHDSPSMSWTRSG